MKNEQSFFHSLPFLIEQNTWYNLLRDGDCKAGEMLSSNACAFDKGDFRFYRNVFGCTTIRSYDQRERRFFHIMTGHMEKMALFTIS